MKENKTPFLLCWHIPMSFPATASHYQMQDRRGVPESRGAGTGMEAMKPGVFAGTVKAFHDSTG